jgi:hypothetical protein
MRLETVEDLEVGDVGFYVIAGRVGGAISLGQGLIDVINLIRGKDVEQSWFSHAFIVTERGEDQEGAYAVIIEAMPGGALRVVLRGRDRLRAGYGWARLPLTEAQKIGIVAQAPALVNVPYSFLDYVAIALLHLGMPRRIIGGYVSRSGHMICSQLVDFLLCRVGFHVFTDGRLSQDVTPGALFHRTGAIGEIIWW